MILQYFLLNTIKLSHSVDWSLNLFWHEMFFALVVHMLWNDNPSFFLYHYIILKWVQMYTFLWYGGRSIWIGSILFIWILLFVSILIAQSKTISLIFGNDDWWFIRFAMDLWLAMFDNFLGRSDGSLASGGCASHW